jgi:hypothetical protein
MKFKENRLAYEKTWGERLDLFWGDIKSAGNRILGWLERGGGSAAHEADNLYKTYIAPSKPEPLDDSTPFEDTYEYYKNLELRYTALYNAELAKYTSLEQQLTKCKVAIEKNLKEVKRLQGEINDIPSEIDVYESARKKFYSTTSTYKSYGRQISEANARMDQKKNEIKILKEETFRIVLGKMSDGNVATVDLLLVDRSDPLAILTQSPARDFIEQKMEEIEAVKDGYKDNADRATYWAGEVLEAREDADTAKKEREQASKEFKTQSIDAMLEEFERLDYGGFIGTGDADLQSRKAFAGEVFDMCSRKKFSPLDIKWEEIYQEDSDINYDGGDDLDEDQKKDNENALAAVEKWIDSKSVQK